MVSERHDVVCLYCSTLYVIKSLSHSHKILNSNEIWNCFPFSLVVSFWCCVLKPETQRIFQEAAQCLRYMSLSLYVCFLLRLLEGFLQTFILIIPSVDRRSLQYLWPVFGCCPVKSWERVFYVAHDNLWKVGIWGALLRISPSSPQV